MQRIQIQAAHPDPRMLKRAVDAMKRGGVIAYPTDTCYGLGCDATDKKAVDKLYEYRRLDKGHRLAIMVADLSDLARYAMVDDQTYRLMRRLTPGPYCFILKATKEAPRHLHLSKKTKTIGIRVPDHEVVRQLVKELGGPIVNTSAGLDDEVFNDPGDIAERFPRIDVLLDADYGGLEPSTVLDLSEGDIHVVREGAGSVEDL